MFARKFIDHVDTHADQLCDEFMQKIQRSDNCKELLHKVSVEELRQSTREMYRNLTDWLLNNTESVSEERYVTLGMRRAGAGCSFQRIILGCVRHSGVFLGVHGAGDVIGRTR